MHIDTQLWWELQKNQRKTHTVNFRLKTMVFAQIEPPNSSIALFPILLVSSIQIFSSPSLISYSLTCRFAIEPTPNLTTNFSRPIFHPKVCSVPVITPSSIHGSSHTNYAPILFHHSSSFPDTASGMTDDHLELELDYLIIYDNKNIILINQLWSSKKSTPLCLPKRQYHQLITPLPVHKHTHETKAPHQTT